MSSYASRTIVSNVNPLYFIAVGLCVVILWRNSQKSPRPPSPPGAYPILGHVFQVTKDLWIPFTAWKEKYGPILSLNIVGQQMIVLNTLKAATDLLDRRSAIYSDRPRDIVGGEMLSGSHLMVLSAYNDRWRRIRRAAHDILSASVITKFQLLQRTEATLFLDDMIKNPDKWQEHFDRMTSSCMLTMVYGTAPMRSHDQPEIKAIMEYVKDMTEATAPGKHLTQLIPALKHLPLWMAPWKRAALESHERYTELFTKFLREGMDRTAHDGSQTLAQSLGQKVKQATINEKEAAWIGAALMTAGTEAILTALGWILKTLVVYPEVQRAGQQEIDRVVGRGRFPDFEDLPNLHYVRAIVFEVMRLFPPTPFAIPHSLREDDWYEGYFLEKGSTVIANVWAINRDPDIYGPDAEVFNPRRYLDVKGQLKENDINQCTWRHSDTDRVVFGSALMITTAYMLWALNLTPPKDERGVDITPDIEAYINVGLIRHVAPFKINVEPRNSDILSLLAAAMAPAGS
ncbi:unnamed protein product [Cyclocybe aegerita]|uniref:Cytochrome P450 n=1 Tax=Cyclocybe aegerita TaxID=1973307 RepID=A0A8S0X5X8_CYCAE|nr:unnamed protein product [Cyclocybe aegerita]